MKLEDKIIWITGASSGIGRHFAEKANSEGAVCILSSRRKEELEKVSSGLKHPKKSFVLPMDISHSDSIQEKTETVLGRFGKIDILLNNAGISQRSLVLDTEISTYRKILETDFFGNIALTKSVLPSMIRNGSGKITVISSAMGKIHTPLRSGYAAAKHALHGFYDCLRDEIWNTGVKIQIVCPGFIRTNISNTALLGDGTEQRKMDDALENGMDAALFAEKLVSAVLSEKTELYIGGRKERFAIFLNHYFPSLYGRIIRKIKVT
ncbi:MAG TPA: SDR family NAD(P)-dependent oxidoreductase [Leptospiraceae bacterium]|nr:SDR family NAD(P)-dependent oxidoreductase [Leptospiraceae bacterium]HNF13196.1 SDR family NAD(P)-dependent oxidoreductase [Leptospiraceae bacterium]HNF24609.1 SDR family NAD(P)-dependent oxidoreductase [Leptospiraceae bacterium]HNI95320.1 SDR family NAD(P)-dependent oxidoreductase [Leptospiraceae bacterium]HNN06633.1 SDR family NAD(P)-dependent oxidoreductase [Leptospiraceae bacterium]